MTNREKHIDKMNNKELAEVLANKCYMDNDNTLNKYAADWGEEEKILKWLEQEAELTADEMFEELGYEFHSKQASDIVYINKIEKYKKYDIKIRIMHFGNGYIKSATQGTSQYLLWITEEEDKAIHKKIEELKQDEE